MRTQSIYMGVRPIRSGEKNSGEQITDEVFIPIPDLIKDYVQNGEHLARAREEYYHSKFAPKEDDLSEFEPISMSADIVEALNYAEDVATHLQKKEAQIEHESREAEKARRAQEEERKRTAMAKSTPDNEGGSGSGGAQ